MPQNQSGQTERERLAVLHALRILDTSPEPVFDELVKAAAEVAQRPISLMSLIDTERQWFKANVGLEGATETPRQYAFCNHVVQNRQVLEVPDATVDERFADNPLVTGAPKIRAYTGVPIELEDGTVLGALCVIDATPGKLSETQVRTLEHLGRAAGLAVTQRAELIRQREAAEGEAAEALRLNQHAQQLEKELRASVQFERRTGRVAGIGGWELELSTNKVHWSEHTCRIHDLPIGSEPSLDEAIGFYPPEVQPILVDAVQRAMTAHVPWDLELPLVTALGRSIWVRAVGAVELEGGEPVRLSGALQDITERRRAVEAMESSERRFRKLFQYSLGLICTHDLDGVLLAVNPAAADSLGYSTADMLGRSLADFMPPARRGHLAVYLGRIEERRIDAGMMELVAHDGSLRYWRYQNVLDVDSDEPYVLGHAQDVTEQRGYEQTLLEWSTMDALTHAMNRRYLARFEQDMAPHATWACIALDIDHFKLVNDTYGHQRGDELLVAVATLLRGACGTDDVVIRMGGDEFIVIVRDPDRLPNVLAQIALRQIEVGVSLSVGSAVREPGQGVDAVIAHADKQLYARRAHTRSRVRAT